MGLKKIFKKITKPVSRFLDKVVPNEIKPFLPYAAAAFPILAPGAFGSAATGIGSLLRAGRFAPQIGGALLQGGVNLGSQLAQEGSEGDFSGLSLGLAGLQGAMSVPGATNVAGDVVRQSSADVFGRAAEGATGLKKVGLGALEKGAKGIAESQGIFQNLGDASIGEIAKASITPFGQGSVDLGMATARKALKDYEDELAAYELETGESQTASDAARRSAIITAMTAGQHSDDVINETLSLLGLDTLLAKDGGIASFKDGGIMDLGGKEMDMRTGGFIPIGKKERADDVPARLSKNEFVMTADAVRAAGGGDINKGAKRMYETMNKLEARA
jgi:hypothetical protein